MSPIEQMQAKVESMILEAIDLPDDAPHRLILGLICGCGCEKLIESDPFLIDEDLTPSVVRELSGRIVSDLARITEETNALRRGRGLPENHTVALIVRRERLASAKADAAELVAELVAKAKAPVA